MATSTENECEFNYFNDTFYKHQKWSNAEVKELINKVKNELSESDTMACSHRMKQLNWDKIKVNGKTGEECFAQIKCLTKNVRRVRNLYEVLSDVDIDAINFVKPKTAYRLYYAEMVRLGKGIDFLKEARKHFKELAPTERRRYKEEHKKQLQIFEENLQKNPNSLDKQMNENFEGHAETCKTTDIPNIDEQLCKDGEDNMESPVAESTTHGSVKIRELKKLLSNYYNTDNIGKHNYNQRINSDDKKRQPKYTKRKKSAKRLRIELELPPKLSSDPYKYFLKHIYDGPSEDASNVYRNQERKIRMLHKLKYDEYLTRIQDIKYMLKNIQVNPSAKGNKIR